MTAFHCNYDRFHPGGSIPITVICDVDSTYRIVSGDRTCTAQKCTQRPPPDHLVGFAIARPYNPVGILPFDSGVEDIVLTACYPWFETAGEGYAIARCMLDGTYKRTDYGNLTCIKADHASCYPSGLWNGAGSSYEPTFITTDKNTAKLACESAFADVLVQNPCRVATCGGFTFYKYFEDPSCGGPDMKPGTNQWVFINTKMDHVNSDCTNNCTLDPVTDATAAKEDNMTNRTTMVGGTWNFNGGNVSSRNLFVRRWVDGNITRGLNGNFWVLVNRSLGIDSPVELLRGFNATDHGVTPPPGGLPLFSWMLPIQGLQKCNPGYVANGTTPLTVRCSRNGEYSIVSGDATCEAVPCDSTDSSWSIGFDPTKFKLPTMSNHPTMTTGPCIRTRKIMPEDANGGTDRVVSCSTAGKYEVVGNRRCDAIPCPVFQSWNHPALHGFDKALVSPPPLSISGNLNLTANLCDKRYKPRGRYLDIECQIDGKLHVLGGNLKCEVVQCNTSAETKTSIDFLGGFFDNYTLPSNSTSVPISLAACDPRFATIGSTPLVVGCMTSGTYEVIRGDRQCVVTNCTRMQNDSAVGFLIPPHRPLPQYSSTPPETYGRCIYGFTHGAGLDQKFTIACDASSATYVKRGGDKNSSCTPSVCPQRTTGPGVGENCSCVTGFYEQILSWNSTTAKYDGSCKDIDECAHPSLNRCTPMARCINTEGNYTCLCPPGYVNGYRRSGVDPGNLTVAGNTSIETCELVGCDTLPDVTTMENAEINTDFCDYNFSIAPASWQSQDACGLRCRDGYFASQYRPFVCTEISNGAIWDKGSIFCRSASEPPQVTGVTMSPNGDEITLEFVGSNLKFPDGSIGPYTPKTIRPCSFYFVDVTYIHPASRCVWISDAKLVVKLDPRATVVPIAYDEAVQIDGVNECQMVGAESRLLLRNHTVMTLPSAPHIAVTGCFVPRLHGSGTVPQLSLIIPPSVSPCETLVLDASKTERAPGSRGLRMSWKLYYTEPTFVHIRQYVWKEILTFLPHKNQFISGNATTSFYNEITKIQRHRTVDFDQINIEEWQILAPPPWSKNYTVWPEINFTVMKNVTWYSKCNKSHALNCESMTWPAVWVRQRFYNHTLAVQNGTRKITVFSLNNSNITSVFVSPLALRNVRSPLYLSITAVNVLGMKSNRSIKLPMSSSPMPNVVLDYPSIISQQSLATVTLASRPPPKNCYIRGNLRPSFLNISWSLQRIPVIQEPMKPTIDLLVPNLSDGHVNMSADKTILSFQPGALSACFRYRIMATANINMENQVPGQPATVQTVVSGVMQVAHPSVVARVNMTDKTVAVTRPLYISAAESYDGYSSHDQSAKLVFKWSCHFRDGNPCLFYEHPGSSRKTMIFPFLRESKSITIPSGHMLPGTVYTLKVSVTAPKTLCYASRSDSAKLSLYAELGTPPYMNTYLCQDYTCQDKEWSLTISNTDKFAYIKTAINITNSDLDACPSTYVIKWVVSTDLVGLVMDPSMFTYHRPHFAWMRGGHDILVLEVRNLPLNKTSLGNASVFASCPNSKDAFFSSTQVFINSGPEAVANAVIAYPVFGEAYSTVFTFIAPGWRDPDGPLKYYFSYIVGGDTGNADDELSLLMRPTYRNRISLFLPQGGDCVFRHITIVVRVRDRFGNEGRCGVGRNAPCVTVVVKPFSGNHNDMYKEIDALSNAFRGGGQMIPTGDALLAVTQAAGWARREYAGGTDSCRNCGNHGSITAPNVCVCRDNYSGEFCQFSPTAGGWSPWSNWTSCSGNCGSGWQYRTRSCNVPTPRGGNTCIGDRLEAKKCMHSILCSGTRNEQWEPWLDLTACSQTCPRQSHGIFGSKPGTKTQIRKCRWPKNDRAPCQTDEALHTDKQASCQGLLSKRAPFCYQDPSTRKAWCVNVCNEDRLQCPTSSQHPFKECSGHGKCVRPQDDCLVSQASICAAVCICENGYGSHDCSVGATTLASKRMWTSRFIDATTLVSKTLVRSSDILYTVNVLATLIGGDTTVVNMSDLGKVLLFVKDMVVDAGLTDAFSKSLTIVGDVSAAILNAEARNNHDMVEHIGIQIKYITDGIGRFIARSSAVGQPSRSIFGSGIQSTSRLAYADRPFYLIGRGGRRTLLPESTFFCPRNSYENDAVIFRSLEAITDIFFDRESSLVFRSPVQTIGFDSETCKLSSPFRFEQSLSGSRDFRQSSVVCIGHQTLPNDASVSNKQWRTTHTVLQSLRIGVVLDTLSGHSSAFPTKPNLFLECASSQPLKFALAEDATKDRLLHNRWPTDLPSFNEVPAYDKYSPEDGLWIKMYLQVLPAAFIVLAIILVGCDRHILGRHGRDFRREWFLAKGHLDLRHGLNGAAGFGDRLAHHRNLLEGPKLDLLSNYREILFNVIGIWCPAFNGKYYVTGFHTLTGRKPSHINLLV